MPLTAYNQVSLPPFMYGTAWKKDATAKLTKLAVESGFQAIDTANQLKHYDEALVGQALQELQKNGVKRDSLFLQTKFTSVDGQDHRLPYSATADVGTQVKQSMESSLQHLHTDYVDSYVLHGPTVRHGLAPADWGAWKAIEELYQEGKARLIGVSNVSAEQLSLLLSKAAVKPMVVQNRCYAVLGWDAEVRQMCRDHQIIYQGFSLLTANARELAQPKIQAIAKRLGATVAQVVFRFSMQVGMLPLTGTTAAKHMQEDLQAEQLSLTDDDIETIEFVSG